MSNPQDSPKTLEELVAQVRAWLDSEEGKAAILQSFEDSDRAIEELRKQANRPNPLQALIDAQKAEVTLDELVEQVGECASLEPTIGGEYLSFDYSKCKQLIQSYIDAQKAEAGEDAIEFSKHLLRQLDAEVRVVPRLSRFELGIAQIIADRDATRDQKLVQEAVKPWRELLDKALSQVLSDHESSVHEADRFNNSMPGVGTVIDYKSPSPLPEWVLDAQALLSQPQEVK